MATGGGLRLAGPVSSPIFLHPKDLPKPSNTNGLVAETQLSYLRKNGQLKTKQFAFIAIYVLIVVLLSTWSDWQALRGRRSDCNLLHTPPLITWSKYAIYASVLKHGRTTLPMTTASGLDKHHRGSAVSTLLCTLLLLCGDIHVNPGPGSGDELPGANGVSPVYRGATDTGAVSYLHAHTQTQTHEHTCLLPMLCAVEDIPVSSSLSPLNKVCAPGPAGTATLKDTTISSLQTQSMETHYMPAGKRWINKRAEEKVVMARDPVQLRHTSVSCHPTAVAKQQKYRLFQTVNHAKVLWDPKVKPKGVFGGHLNIRSAVPKSEQLEQLLTYSNLDFLCLSETWLKPSIRNSVIHIPGCNIHRRDRGHGKGGGVMIYVKDSFQCTQIEAVGDVLECMGIKIRLSPEMSFAVIVLYRPPSTNDLFFNHFTDMLKKCDAKEILLMGDFNINWFDKNGRKKLKEITQKFNLTQMIDKATRITKTSQTLIDLVFTNKADRITKIYNLITGLSDHNLTLVARKLSKARYRNLHKIDSNEHVSYIPRKDYEVFNNEIRQSNWSETVNEKNCCAAAEDFTKTLQQLVLKYSKVKKLKKRGKNPLPWLNNDLWKLMRTRDAALKKYHKTGLTTDRLTYNQLRNKVIQQLRHAKATFYINLIKQAKGNSKQLWQIIDKLTGKRQSRSGTIELKIDGEDYTNGPVVANYFSDYFTDSVNEITQQSSGFLHFCVQPQSSISDSEALCFKFIDNSKTDKLIQSLSNSKAKDYWGLDSSLIKTNRDILTPAITQIINKSINESVFPDVFKTAVVTPIHKSGAKNETSNYRPISILPVVSKIIEKAIGEQLMEHFHNNNFLHPTQFGFRRNHSTDAACCYLVENIKLSLDRGGTVGAVFLDLRKAFDTVNHRVLLSKLSQYNLSDDTLQWLQSYLSNRMQCVRTNNALSSLKSCTTGVPQGSILGPLLFSIYINDLPTVCKDINIIMYADDAVIYVHGMEMEQVASKLSSAMNDIQNWLKSSCLTLNVKKTVGMFFTKSYKPKKMPDIFVNGEKISIATDLKYLGVHLDQTLSFKKHIKKLCNSIKYNISSFRHIRNSLTTEASFMYFNALIISHIPYCLSQHSNHSDLL